jgi:hypothetical protein
MKQNEAKQSKAKQSNKTNNVISNTTYINVI